MTTSLILFLCSSPKTQIKVRLTESRDEHSHLLKPRLWATKMNDLAPNSVTIACSCDYWCERSCMGVLVTLRLSIPSSSHISHLSLLCYWCYTASASPPCRCLALVVYLESLLLLEWHSLTLPPVMMQLYNNNPSSLSACFSFSLCPHSCISLLCHPFPLIPINSSLLISPYNFC